MAEATSEMDVLLNAGLRAARGMLLEQREFAPFALVMSPDGQVRQLRSKAESKDQPIDHLIALTQQFLRELAAKKEAKATAVLSEVQIRDAERGETAAIRVQLEHAAGGPITCYLPYTLSDEGVTPGKLVAEHGETTVFPAAAAPAPQPAAAAGDKSPAPARGPAAAPAAGKPAHGSPPGKPTSALSAAVEATARAAAAAKATAATAPSETSAANRETTGDHA